MISLYFQLHIYDLTFNCTLRRHDQLKLQGIGSGAIHTLFSRLIMPKTLWALNLLVNL